jgi:nucleoredoxin
VYKDLQAAGKPFELIFCSSDQDEKSFQGYFDTQPWAAIPWSALAGIKGTLSQKYNVQGIPALVVIDSKGNLITKNGRGDVSSKKAGAFDVWAAAAQ